MPNFPATPEYLLAAAVFPFLQQCVGVTATLLVLPTIGRRLKTSVRRALHQQRRRKTAKALHALRYDREYLLGQLPPIVSAQILSYLDRASLASLRAACRQASLLVAATGGARLRLDLPAVVHYTDVPLSAVWPRLKVLSLSLHATQDATTAWLRPSETASHAAARQGLGAPGKGVEEGHTNVGLGLGNGGVGSGGAMGAGLGAFGYASEPPSADCCIADAALRGFLHSRGLEGLPGIRLLDLAHCSASFELATWQLLARALPDGCTIMAPVSALQGARRTGYASRAAHVHQVLPAMRVLASRCPTPPTTQQVKGEDTSLGQPQRPKGLRLELVGVNLQVSSFAALQELCQVGAHLLVRLALSDTYPYKGNLPWGPLALLSSLRELSVTPATPASLTALLEVLPALPHLTHLALGDVGSAHSAARSVQVPPPGAPVGSSGGSSCTTVHGKELQQLQMCAKLMHLELHTLRLPPAVEAEAPAPSTLHPSGTLGGPATHTSQAASSSSSSAAGMHAHQAPSHAAAAAVSSSTAAAAAAAAAAVHTRTTLPPLTALQSLSVLHVEVQRPRHTGVGQEQPPTASSFLHLFPNLTHLSLGVCPRSSHRIALGLTHAAAAAATSTAATLASVSSDILDPSGAAAAAAAAAGLPVPRPPPLLPLLSGLQHLQSLVLTGAWAAHGMREASAAAAAPEANQGVSSVALEAALVGLRRVHLYHCVAYDQLCRLLQPLLQLPHLHSLGLHFCGTAPKGTQSGARGQQPGHQANGPGSMQAAYQAVAQLQALMGNNAAAAAPGGFEATPDGASQHGLVAGPERVTAMVNGAISLRELTIEGGDFQLAQEVCMSDTHRYTDLTLTSCDMLLECDVAAALAVRARCQQAAELALVGYDHHDHQHHHHHHHQQQQQQQQQQRLQHLAQVAGQGETGGEAVAMLAQVALNRSCFNATETPCPLRRLQVLACRGIDGRALEMASLQLKLPFRDPVEVACTDWRCVEEAFEKG